MFYSCNVTCFTFILNNSTVRILLYFWLIDVQTVVGPKVVYQCQNIRFFARYKKNKVVLSSFHTSHKSKVTLHNHGFKYTCQYILYKCN